MGNTFFKKLVLRNNNLSGKQIFIAQTVLKQNAGLTLLDLQNCNLQNDTFEYLFTGLADNQSTILILLLLIIIIMELHIDKAECPEGTRSVLYFYV